MKKYISILMTTVLALAFLAPAISVADPADVTFDVTPHNPTVVLQPSGGTFDFFVEAGNNNGNSLNFHVWTKATLPDGSQIPRVSGPANFVLPDNWTASSNLSQRVPASAPAGTYTFSAVMGLYPNTVYAVDNFTLEKLAASTSWFGQYSGTTEWLSTIYFVDDDNGWIAGARNTILHTVDGGDNWYEQSPPPSTNYNDLYFVDPMYGWAVGSSTKIVHTEDGGATWMNQDSSSTGDYYGVFFVDALTGWVAGGKEQTFLPATRFINRTTDGGLTWTNQYFENNQNPLKDIFFIDGYTGWAVGLSGGILHTTDGGISWDIVFSGAPYDLRGICFTDALHGFVVGRDNLLSSSDGGMTWTPYPIGTGLTLTGVSFADPLNGWAVGGWNDNTSIILHTDDGGATWNEQVAATMPGSLADVSFVNSATGWAIGYDGSAIKTITGGN